jgi:carbon storage regulator
MKGIIMLVLSRKIGERVCVGKAVVVTVVAVQNGRVRLAFDAPDNVAIDREEVRERFGADETDNTVRDPGTSFQDKPGHST